jgi:hypothetical protein
LSAVYQKALFTLVAETPDNNEERLSIKSKRYQALGHIKYTGPDIEKTCVVQETVLQWITRLRGHERCSRIICDLLDLIKDHLLVVDAQRRITSSVLLAKLQKLAARAKTDEAYLLSPAPRDVTSKVTEETRSTKAQSSDEFADGEESLLNRLNTLIGYADMHDGATVVGLDDKVSVPGSLKKITP